MSNCGINITELIRAINSGKEIKEINNYEYDSWTLFHCAALVGRKDVINYFLNKGVSLDIEASKYNEEYMKTPRTILSFKFPEILKDLEFIEKKVYRD